jgi:hypothetical protein
MSLFLFNLKTVLRVIALIPVLSLVACSYAVDEADAGACAAGVTYLDSLPVTRSTSYEGIVPLGDIDPADERVFPSDHIRFVPFVDDAGAVPPTFVEFNVGAPGNGMKVVSVVTKTYDTAGISEYSVYLRPCTDLKVYVQHLSSLSAELQAQLEAVGWTPTKGYCLDGEDFLGEYSACAVRIPRVTLSSQDLIGTAGKYRPLAFGLYDKRVTVPYVTARYYTISLAGLSEILNLNLGSRTWIDILFPSLPDYNHSACPLSYYPAEDEVGFPEVTMIDPALNSIGAWDGTNCGKFVEESKSSGASGNWFLKAALDEVLAEDGVNVFGSDQLSVALVHDRINKNAALVRDYPVFSIGNEIPITGGAMAEFDPGRYDFIVATTGNKNRDFNDLIVGTEYCYESLSEHGGAAPFTGVIRLLMTDSTTLLFQAFGAGGDDCTNTTINGGAITFNR